MMLYHYINKYKSTLMFKTLCNWAIPWDPYFNNYYFGPHKICNIFSLLSISAGQRGTPSPHVIFIFLFPSSLLLHFFFPFSHLSLPKLGDFLHSHWSSSSTFWRIKEATMEDQSKLRISKFFKNQGKGSFKLHIWGRSIISMEAILIWWCLLLNKEDQ